MILPELLPVLAIHLYALGTAAVVAGILARLPLCLRCLPSPPTPYC